MSVLCTASERDFLSQQRFSYFPFSRGSWVATQLRGRRRQNALCHHPALLGSDRSSGPWAMSRGPDWREGKPTAQQRLAWHCRPAKATPERRRSPERALDGIAFSSRHYSRSGPLLPPVARLKGSDGEHRAQPQPAPLLSPC